MQTTQRKTTCPCCLGHHLDHDLFVRPCAPALNNRLHRTREEAFAAPTGRIALCRCRKCGFVFNADFEAGLVTYDAGYNSDRSDSPAYARHLNRAAQLVRRHLPPEARVLEPGCGNGHFLRLLAKTGIEAVGYDPALPPDTLSSAGATLHARCFAPSAHKGPPPDGLILRHVLEHVEHPRAFLQDLLSSGLVSHGVIYVEVPDLDWIVKHGATYDLTYEHCNYFCRKSLVNLMNELGWSLETLETGYDGQYLMAMFKVSILRELNTKTPSEEVFPPLASLGKERLLHETFSRGPVCVWGASGKGVLLTCSLPPDLLQQVAMVVDVDRKKQGLFMPMVGLEVRPPRALKEAGAPTRVVVMNPVYMEEITRMIDGMGIAAQAECIV